MLLQDLPAPLWTDRVASWVAAGVTGAQPAESRPRLLEVLAARRPEDGLGVARSILRGRSLKQVLGLAHTGRIIGPPDPLALQAVEVLLALAPDEAWPRIKEGVALQGAAFLEHLRGLGHGARVGLEVHWWAWPPERILGLARLLFAAYPPKRDPPEDDDGKGHVVTQADELRRLRWRALDHLVLSPSPAAAAEAKEIHTQAREYVKSLEATRAAAALLAGAVPRGQGIQIDEACRLLDEEHYRLIRSADDLLEVVVEELGEIERTIGYDRAMLFGPSRRGKEDPRRREEALRAYVIRRLADRLPGKVLDRETEVKRGRRLDIRVMAPVVETRELVTAVLEVKWSDNSGARRGISTGLTEQLGKDYLVASDLLHGVFLVAWTGKLGTWIRSAGPRPERRTAPALADALRRQAEVFRRQHPAVDIRPVVWDVS